MAGNNSQIPRTEIFSKAQDPERLQPSEPAHITN